MQAVTTIGLDLNPLLGIPVVPWLPILGLVVVSGIIATLLSRTRSPNAWLMAPLFIAAAASHLGSIEGRMPDVLLIAAQVLIGSALGAQFKPEFLTRLFRLLWASCVVELFAAGSMAVFAAAIAWLGGYPVPTMVLAMAPAGIAEMGSRRNAHIEAEHLSKGSQEILGLQ